MAIQFTVLKELLDKIQGCTFASLDADTKPVDGFLKEVRNEVVLLFNTRGVSGYENMVRRRLTDIGKSASSFTVGDLPWGTRIDNLPVIENGGKKYLQTILVKPGEVKGYLGSGVFKQEIDTTLFKDVFFRNKDVRQAACSQGLPVDKAVIVRTYDIENIVEIRLMYEKLKA